VLATLTTDGNSRAARSAMAGGIGGEARATPAANSPAATTIQNAILMTKFCGGPRNFARGISLRMNRVLGFADD
jgi:hypothetical protein